MDVLIGAAIMFVGFFMGALFTVSTFKTLSSRSEVERKHTESLIGLVSHGAISPNEARNFAGYKSKIPEPIKLPTISDSEH